MYYAAMAVNEFLARLNPYRDDPNGKFLRVCHSLTQMQQYLWKEDNPCVVLSRQFGSGYFRPLLDFPELSEGEKR